MMDNIKNKIRNSFSSEILDNLKMIKTSDFKPIKILQILRKIRNNKKKIFYLVTQ